LIGNCGKFSIARRQKLHQAGKWPEAIPEFRRAVALNPKSAEPHQLLALALYSIKFKRVGNTNVSGPGRRCHCRVPSRVSPADAQLSHCHSA
jgi:hypothetical protein